MEERDLKKAASKQVAAECFGGKSCGPVTSLTGRETGKMSRCGAVKIGRPAAVPV